MLRSLSSRLLLSYLLIILVCLVVVGLGLLLFVRMSPLWNRGTTLQVETASRTTMPLLRHESLAGDLSQERLQALLESVASELDVRILMVDRTGQVLFDTQQTWVGEDLSVALPARMSMPMSGLRTAGTFVDSEGAEWAFAAEPLRRSGNDRQVIVFAALQTRSLALAWFTENILPSLARAGLVALVVSILLALIVSASVGAPLRRVAHAVQAITRGETGVRAPVSGPQEVQDVAQALNRMVVQVEASRQSQREFVANVSHDLKTPLTSIQGFSQALLDGTVVDREGTLHAAGIISEEAERMRRMVDDLLILARFDAGQVALAREPVALAPLLQRCIDYLAPQAERAGVTVVLDAHEPATVIGDPDRLVLVFTNLLDNGIAHTPVGGQVTLTLRWRPGTHQTEVEIADTGEGIPAEELPRLFERFYQVDKSRRRGRGVGLGLAIAKEIAEAHGGEINAESTPGLGSRFTVRLPLDIPTASPDSGAAARSSAPRPQPKTSH
ncbi:MAG: sensor histidine kinase [Anaerolineales bacterium]|nr:sensor histidine kinase [Anaerolineales bacterium]